MPEELINKVDQLEYLVIISLFTLFGLGLILILYFYRMGKVITELQEKHNMLVGSVLKVEQRYNKYIDETIRLLIELSRKLNK